MRTSADNGKSRWRIVVLLLAALLPGACASVHDAGWQGDGAEPFDGARDDCETETATTAPKAQRDAAFDACMARHGWRRP